MEERRIENPLIFYDAFFETAPDAKKYFPRDDFSKLGRKFNYTMDFIVSNCHQLDEIKDSIEDLGRIHVKLKIENEFYEKFNESLLVLVDKILGTQNSKEIETSWSKALTHIAGIMQNAPEKEENKFQQLLRKLFG